MSDASSVPLAAEPGPREASAPFTQRATCLAAFAGAALLMLLSMCAKPALPGGLWLGLLGAGVAVPALIGWLVAPSEAQLELSLGELTGPLGHCLAAGVWSWLLLRLAVAGVLPAQNGLLAVAAPLGCIWFAAGAASLAARLGFLADPARPLWRRHGFWLLAITALLQLPRLGSFGLIDPWETHYGEVAREMLERDDWISLWWAQDGWFWSKPILNFWAQGLSFSALGVATAPDHMIASLASGQLPEPEWAARLPVFLLALAGQHVLYLGARAYVGRAAAFWGVLVLATTPYWYLLTRQSMADMAYVGPMCAALGLLLLALQVNPEQRVRSTCVRLGGSRLGLTLDGQRALMLAIAMSALPQIVYLLSRNVRFEWGELPLALGLHRDAISVGSPGNCGLPGNLPCRADLAGNAQPLQPAGSALIWAVCLGVVLWRLRAEQRLKPLLYLAAWLCVAFSFMGKGAPGLVLVLAVFLGFLLTRGRLAELAHAEWLGLGLLLGCVALPWFVQEYLRHGGEFFERLFVHDMYQRAFSHVHDTNLGDDTSFRYYVWQLGYGLFPWSGLCAAGTLYCLGQAGRSQERTGLVDLIYFCALWLLAAFGMFALTGTKYHHYVLPLVPAVALLTGIFCQQALDRTAPRQRGTLAVGALSVLAAALVGLCGRDLASTQPGDVTGAARLLQLFTYNYARSWPATLDFQRPLWLLSGVAVLLCLGLLAPRMRRAALLGFGGFALLAAAWVIDVYLVRIAPHWGQRETISEYYLRRAGPNEPLVAYQLNWKGENFYTGNAVPAFVASGKRFTDWVEAQKKAGVGVMYFTTEHSRIGTLERELGATRKFELCTTPELNDKLVLARAEL